MRPAIFRSWFRRLAPGSLLLVLFVLSVSFGHAQVRPPNRTRAATRPALAAQSIDRHNLGIEAAEIARDNAIASARSAMLKTLEASKTAVLKAGHLDAANAIQAVIVNPDSASTNTTIKDPVSRSAMSKYEAARKSANDAYTTQIRQLAADFAAALEKDKVAAMQAGDLEQANAIHALLQSSKPPPPAFDHGDAKRVVFIADATGTMINKTAAQRRELWEGIGALKEGTQYTVVFFTDAGRVFTAQPKLVAATADARRATAEWVQTVVAKGTTDPVPAIQAAFALKPDVIYLMSDGGYNNLRTYDQVAAEFAKNRRLHPARVSTIFFDDGIDREAADFMEQLAAKSGGSFRKVGP